MNWDTLGTFGLSLTICAFSLQVLGMARHNRSCEYYTVYYMASLYIWIVSAVVMDITSIFQKDWSGVVLYSLFLVAFLNMFRKLRKQRKITMKLVGDKTKRILASMVKKIRSLPKPARRLQPA